LLRPKIGHTIKRAFCSLINSFIDKIHFRH
jgi:hypothetical protein